MGRSLHYHSNDSLGFLLFGSSIRREHSSNKAMTNASYRWKDTFITFPSMACNNVNVKSSSKSHCTIKRRTLEHNSLHSIFIAVPGCCTARVVQYVRFVYTLRVHCTAISMHDLMCTQIRYAVTRVWDPLTYFERVESDLHSILRLRLY